MGKNLFDAIPDEILVLIFSNLTEVELYRIRRVCWRWLMIIKDKSFCYTFPENMSTTSEKFLDCCRNNRILSFQRCVEDVIDINKNWNRVCTTQMLWVEGMTVAAKHRSAPILEKILSFGPVDNFTQSLYDAVSGNHVSSVKLLLRKCDYSLLIIDKAIDLYSKTEEMKTLLRSRRS